MSLRLADLQKRWKARSLLAISIESSRVNVDTSRRENGRIEMTHAFALPLGADAVVADPESAGKELAAHLDAAGIRQRRCVVCVPPGWALTASTDLPPMNAEDLRGYLELRAEREFPVPVSELRLASCVYTLPDGKERATLAAVPAVRLSAIERMLEVAGCRATSISFGVDRCRSSKEEAALHFIANGNHVDLVIGAGGGIAALRSIAHIGKENGATFDPATFAREVRITLGRLPESLRRQVKEARFAGTRTSAEFLRRETEEPLRRLGIASRIVDTEPAGKGMPEHAGAAIEAAARQLHGKPVAFEFVAPKVARWQTVFQRFDSRRRRWAIAAASLFIVLPLVVFIIRARIERSLANEWKAMQKNVAELESLQRKIRTFRPWFDAVPQAVGAFDGLALAFPDQGDVWAKSIQLGENNKVTCSGFAKTQPALMSLVERLRTRPDVAMVQIQQVRGENPVQFSLTYKWEPQNAK